MKEIRKNRNPWSLDKFKFGHLHGMDSKMDNGDVFGGKKLKKTKVKAKFPLKDIPLIIMENVAEEGKRHQLKSYRLLTRVFVPKIIWYRSQ